MQIEIRELIGWSQRLGFCIVDLVRLGCFKYSHAWCVCENEASQRIVNESEK